MVVSNVIDTHKFSLSQKLASNRVNLGILGGMNTNRKGIDVLLKALSLLPDKDTHLHIGGDGLLLDHYKKSAIDLGISGKFTFYGPILPDRVTDFYSLLDIYVLASRDETFGVVVIEAMASGLPVIATKCGGPEEIVIPENGILVETENENEMADAISHMSENLDLYDKVAIKKYAEEKFGQKAFLKKINAVYDRIVAYTYS
jgi:glycosyltransferase involved in cell wall biosynthesis